MRFSFCREGSRSFSAAAAAAFCAVSNVVDWPCVYFRQPLACAIDLFYEIYRGGG